MMGEKMCTENFTVQQLQLSTVTFFQLKKFKKNLYKCWNNFFKIFLAQNWQGSSGLKHSHRRFKQKSIDIFKDLNLKLCLAL